jgi:hypothetical protein
MAANEAGNGIATMKQTQRTTEPVQPGWTAQIAPEFLRTNDVRKIFGIPRGSLYGLAKLGKIKGCLLRIRGAKSGLRLWSVDSIRTYLAKQMIAGEDAQ